MVERLWFGSAGMRIAGGTDEVVLNSIGERVLGLTAGAPCGQGPALLRTACLVTWRGTPQCAASFYWAYKPPFNPRGGYHVFQETGK